MGVAKGVVSSAGGGRDLGDPGSRLAPLLYVWAHIYRLSWVCWIFAVCNLHVWHLAMNYLFLSSVCLLTYLWRQRSPPPVHCRPHLVTHSPADTHVARARCCRLLFCPWAASVCDSWSWRFCRDRRRRKSPSMAICQIKASACRRRASGDRLRGRRGVILSGSFLLYSCGNVHVKVLIHLFINTEFCIY